MHVRGEHWKFGPRVYHSDQEAAWWSKHEPVVDAWIGEMEAGGDAWWPSAQHAAFCLVSYQEIRGHLTGAAPSWDELDVADFLFHDLSEGGTVASFGSVPIFFDHLVEALRRFAGAGLVDEKKAEAWLAEMRAAREDFIRYYGDDRLPEEARAIRARYR